MIGRGLTLKFLRLGNWAACQHRSGLDILGLHELHQKFLSVGNHKALRNGEGIQTTFEMVLEGFRRTAGDLPSGFSHQQVDAPAILGITPTVNQALGLQAVDDPDQDGR